MMLGFLSLVLLTANPALESTATDTVNILHSQLWKVRKLGEGCLLSLSWKSARGKWIWSIVIMCLIIDLCQYLFMNSTLKEKVS